MAGTPALPGAKISVWHPHRSSPGRCRPPREVIGPHIDRDGRQAQHDADPEQRRMMDASPIAWRRSRLHSITSSALSRYFIGHRVADAAPDLIPQGYERRGRQRRRRLGSLDAIDDETRHINFSVGIIAITAAISTEQGWANS